MLLHLGGDLAVNSRHILALLDVSVIMGTQSGRAALRKAEAAALVERCALPAKSVVLADTPRGICWYFSPLGTAALGQRLREKRTEVSDDYLSGEEE